MDFINETAAINGLADYIVKSGACLYNSVKYIYALAENDFYRVNIKDVFKVMLNNIPDADKLRSLGLRIDDRSCREMQSPEYNKVLNLMAYSLAVRIPVMKSIKCGTDVISDDQLYKIYTAVLEKGAENYDDMISETFLETKYLVRKGKKLPPFTADWYKTYIYAKVPALAEITNKNMFLLGAADMLFSMFYSCVQDGLAQKVLEYVNGADETNGEDDEE